MKKLLLIIILNCMIAACGDDLYSADADTLKNITNQAIDRDAMNFRVIDGNYLGFEINQESPYTGWAKSTSSDGDQKISHYLNGSIVEEFGLFKNGQKSYISQVVNENDTKVTYWDMNGEKESSGIIKNGKMTNLVKFKDGQPIE